MIKIVDLQFVRKVLAYSEINRYHWTLANTFILNNFSVKASKASIEVMLQ